MVEVKKVVVDDRGGDGNILRRLPKGVAKPLRSMALNLRDQRQKRLARVARRLFPTLQALEASSVPAEGRLLAGRKFAAALSDDLAIERALALFKSARAAGVIEFRNGPARTPVPPEDETMVLGACGMSLSSAERFFLFRAARLIFRKHPKIKFNVKGMLGDPAVLPRLRLLASMEPQAVLILQHGLGVRFKELLYPENHDRLAAITQLRYHHVRGLMETLGTRCTDIAGWAPDFVSAIAEALTCYEQVRDIGNYFLVLKGSAAVRALGRWSIRDVTEKMNEDLTRRGGEKMAGNAYETDIGNVRNILGGDFSLLMEQPAELLDAVRLMVAYLRTIDKKNERADRVEEFRLFAKRYLAYMNPDILDALHLTDVPAEGDVPPPISFREALGILEGLWTKEGVGRVFFEQTLPTPHGMKALRALVEDLLAMKKRGSIKANTDIAAILSGSDLFDSHLVPFMTRRNNGFL